MIVQYKQLISVVGLVACVHLLTCPSRVFAEPAATEAGRSSHTWKWLWDWYPGDFPLRDIVPRTVEHSELRIRDGDDPHWAEPQWDDSRWQVCKDREIPYGAGVFWVRLRVRSPDSSAHFPSTLVIIANCPYEIFWDGVLVRRSGIPHSDPRTEVSGNYVTAFDLLESMVQPGEHVVAVRMSNVRERIRRPIGTFIFYTVAPEAYQTFDRKARMLPTLAVGAVLSMGLVAFVMWMVVARRPTLLLFSVLNVLLALMVALAAVRFLFPFPGDWSYPSAVVQALIVALGSGCLVILVLTHFEFPYRRQALIALATTDALVAWAHFPAMLTIAQEDFWRIAFGATLVSCAWAAWQRKRGAWLVMAGALSTVGLSELVTKQYMHTYFWPGQISVQWVFLPTLVGLLSAIALSVREERRQAREATLTAARLEIELLKQSLQPHFLLNTLMALAQAVEESPAKAVKLIDDLAEEFRSLSRISGEKQIPLARELDLCRAHLRVMSVRTESDLSLQTEGVDPSAQVPPAVFLTLIENAFAHQRMDSGPAVFRLRAASRTNGVSYWFFSPGQVLERPARADGGTGLRYIKARLEEGWPGGWRLDQAPAPGGWETIISLHQPGFSGTLP